MSLLAHLSPPAVWGKLPSSGDFVRHQASSEQIEAWRLWLDKQTWLNEGDSQPVAAPTQQRMGEAGWHSLSPVFQQKTSAVHRLPWSFVMSPDILPFARQQWVVGILAGSRDKVGRNYPLVIYHTVNKAWLKRHINQNQGWLFWLSRLAAAHIAQVSTTADINLTEQLEQLWHLQQPGWRNWLGRAENIDARACRQIINTPDNYPNSELQGVCHLPWADWPHVLWAKNREVGGWCWQQDGAGRFLDARRF